MPTSAHHLNNSELFHSFLFRGEVVITTTWQRPKNDATSGAIAPIGGTMKLRAAKLFSTWPP
eukprot:6846150-Alexandrium_andersonii.AAC.1